MRKSRVLREMADGCVATCVKTNLTDPRVTELCGLAGFSSIWMCNEHVPSHWLSIENCVRAAKLFDMDTIVRVAKGSYSEYVKPFECDATGIMVPHVATADEARAVVDTCRFHPLGRRAIDGGNADGLYTRMPMRDYLENGNTQRFIILQIESPEALENVEAIAAVPGYDFLLFGPGDFSHRIGHAGDINHADVVAARARVEAACLKHGKPAFAVGLAGTPAAELKARGYRLTHLASDVALLGNALAERVQAFQSSDDKNTVRKPLY